MDIVLHPATEEALRSSWLFSSIEAYVEWLERRRAARSTITRRIPHLVRFGEFARECGAESASDLTEHVAAFVECRAGGSSLKRSVDRQTAYERELRVGTVRNFVYGPALLIGEGESHAEESR